MSFDLAIYAGDLTASDEEASETYRQLMERNEEAGARETPDPRLLACAADLRRRYPDDRPESIWAFMPLRPNGPLLSINLKWDVSTEALEFIASTAAKHSLVCYDPQDMRVVRAIDTTAMQKSHAEGQKLFQAVKRSLFGR